MIPSSLGPDYKELESCHSHPYNKKNLDKRKQHLLWFGPSDNWGCRADYYPESIEMGAPRELVQYSNWELLTWSRSHWACKLVGTPTWKFWQIAAGWVASEWETPEAQPCERTGDPGREMEKGNIVKYALRLLTTWMFSPGERTLPQYRNEVNSPYSLQRLHSSCLI